MPQASIDPVVMAAFAVCGCRRSSRARSGSDAAVVTVGALQAGTKENVIPDDALIKLNVRTFDEAVRQRVLDAIKRIVNAESEAPALPSRPEITPPRPLRPGASTTTRQPSSGCADAFPGSLRRSTGWFNRSGPASASEDFGSFGVEWHVPSGSGLSAGSIPRPTPRPSARAS